MKHFRIGKEKAKPAARQPRPAARPPLPIKQPEAIPLPPAQSSPEPWQAMNARTTAIDSVLRDILSSGEPISIIDLSKKYDVPKELMAEWVDVLEHKGFIKVDYSAGGASKASAPKPTKAAKEKSPERRDPSKRPTLVITIVLLAVIALFAMQAMNVFRQAPAFNSSSLEFSPEIDISQKPGTGKSFEFNLDSAAYTAAVEYSAGGIEEYGVYLDKGKARVDSDAYSLVFDGANYLRINQDNTTEAIDKAFFDGQMAKIMPWTYIDMVKGSPPPSVSEIVDGKTCRLYALQDGNSLCMLESQGFPLKFTSPDFTVTFTAVDINPENMPDLFPNQNG